MRGPESQPEADAAEDAAIVDMTTLFYLQAEAIEALGVDPRMLAEAILYAGINLYGRAVGLEQTPGWLRKSADEMERTFPLERSVN